MGEPNGMGRRALAVFALAIALVLAASASAQTPESEKAEVDARIAALQAEIAEAKADEGVLTSQLSAVVAELEDAQTAVDSAQASLSSLEAELTSAQARLDELTALLERQTRRLERLRAEYRKAVGILEARVRAAYIDEPPDVVSFLVSASSFDEIIDSVELVSRISRQDQRITRAGREGSHAGRGRAEGDRRTKRLQTATVSVISARTSEARVVRDQLATDRDRLATVQSLKSSALSDTRETREEYLREVEALAAQSAELAARIREAQQQAGTSSGTGSSGTGSAGTGQPSAAGFVWPCDGVVVSGFGMRWGRMHEGIDIGCAYGTPNRAAASGTVIYSGWLGGYGNLVVVDHGNGLSTAYAHASSLLVGVGQSVSQGETVSLVGSTGNSSGPHLHFEVRVNGDAVDSRVLRTL